MKELLFTISGTSKKLYNFSLLNETDVCDVFTTAFMLEVRWYHSTNIRLLHRSYDVFISNFLIYFISQSSFTILCNHRIPNLVISTVLE